MTQLGGLAITRPSQVPLAAVRDLVTVSEVLSAAATSRYAGEYSLLLSKLSAVALAGAEDLTAVVNGEAKESQVASLINVERVAKASIQLFDALASINFGRPQVGAMTWASLCRRIYAATALVRSEHAPTTLFPLSADIAVRARVRILPGAELAVQSLTGDPLSNGATWDVPALAEALARWVVA